MLHKQADLFDIIDENLKNCSVTFKREGDWAFRSLSYGDQIYSERSLSAHPNRSVREDFFVSSLNSGVEAVTPANKKLTYIDLFCGGGGLSLGVHNAGRFLGFSPRLALAADTDPHALNLVKAHFNPIYSRNKSVEELVEYEADLTGNQSDFTSPPRITDSQIASLKGRIDLIVGGPPCQGHSNLNNKTRRFDPRNLLYLVMPAFALALDIPTLIIENVQTITKAKEDVVGITSRILRTHGYAVEEYVLKASDFGVAQSRTRHFLVASKEQALGPSGLIRAFAGEPLSFDQACLNLPSIHEKLSIIEDIGSISTENMRRINFLHDNSLYDLPNFARPDCHQNGTTYQSVYGRIHGNLPMTTITTGFSSPGRGRYVHPAKRRPITIREAGRVQAFPDDYWKKAVDLDMKRNHLQKIIGDAVPSLMAYPLLSALFASPQKKR